MTVFESELVNHN